MSDPNDDALDFEDSAGEDDLIDAPDASLFIRKLYQMIDNCNQKQETMARWGRGGATFLVDKSANFAETVLPTYFTHSNISSFVRQLNKYQFHKVKISPEAQSNEMWEFQHPYFHQGNTQQLGSIKRKGQAGALPNTTSRTAPPKRKKAAPEKRGKSPAEVSQIPVSNGMSMMQMPMSGMPMTHIPMSGGMPGSMSNPSSQPSQMPMIMQPSFMNFMPSSLAQTSVNPMDDLQLQIDNLTKLQSDMAAYLQTLSKNYHVVVDEILTFRQSMMQQDQVIRNLVEYLVSRDAGTFFWNSNVF
jgi:hypothetical protein